MTEPVADSAPRLLELAGWATVLPTPSPFDAAAAVAESVELDSDIDEIEDAVGRMYGPAGAWTSATDSVPSRRPWAAE